MAVVVVASTNPVKVLAVQHGFSHMFPAQVFEYQTISVPSGVSDQPCTDEETLTGALNRSLAAQQSLPQANFWVGVEGGVEWHGEEMAAYAWIVIRSNELTGKSRTGVFFLPSRVAELVRQGKELGEADDIVFGRSNSKQENGAVGLLSGNVLDRAQLYGQAVILALIPFKNPHLYDR